MINIFGNQTLGEKTVAMETPNSYSSQILKVLHGVAITSSNEFKMSYKRFPKSARKVLLFVPIDSVKASIRPLPHRERAMDCNCGLGKGT